MHKQRRHDQSIASIAIHCGDTCRQCPALPSMVAEISPIAAASVKQMTSEMAEGFQKLSRSDGRGDFLWVCCSRLQRRCQGGGRCGARRARQSTWQPQAHSDGHVEATMPPSPLEGAQGEMECLKPGGKRRSSGSASQYIDIQSISDGPCLEHETDPLHLTDTRLTACDEDGKEV